MRHVNNTARCGSHSLEKHNGFAQRWLLLILFLFQYVITPTIGDDSTENNCVQYITGPIYLSASDDSANAGFGYSIANIGQINSAKANSSQLRWENQSEKRDFLIEKKSLEGKLVALNLMLEELKNTQVNTRKQQKILSQRMTGSEYNSVALADVIVQDINLFVEVLDTEISLYLTDLQLSHVKTELLSRFKLAL